MFQVMMSLAVLGLASVVLAKGKDVKSPEPKGATKKQASTNIEPDTTGRLNDDGTIVCPTHPPVIPDFPRSAVYAVTPYKAGEVAEYGVSYFGAKVGIAKLEVRSPYKVEIGPKRQPVWHRSFHVDAATGDWYKYIFVAHDRVDSYVRPWDHAVSRFFIEQDEGKMFGRRFQQKKWLDFNQELCSVDEKTDRVGKDSKTGKFPIAYRSMDTLGVGYWLREQTYEVNKPVRTLVYSSEKNWWLEAMPLAIEEVKVKAGIFKKAAKLKLQTFIGKDLQQKGDVLVWIDQSTPARPLVQIKAEIKLGSVWIELQKLSEGK